MRKDPVRCTHSSLSQSTAALLLSRNNRHLTTRWSSEWVPLHGWCLSFSLDLSDQRWILFRMLKFTKCIEGPCVNSHPCGNITVGLWMAMESRRWWNTGYSFFWYWEPGLRLSNEKDLGRGQGSRRRTGLNTLLILSVNWWHQWVDRVYHRPWLEALVLEADEVKKTPDKFSLVFDGRDWRSPRPISSTSKSQQELESSGRIRS